MPSPNLAAAIAGDIKALRRLAREKHGRVAAMLAEVAVRTRSEHVANQAGASLASRKHDPTVIPAFAKVLRATPAKAANTAGFEWVASALAKRKEPAALRAAIASYRAMPAGRARYFLMLGLSNRVERDRTLRASPAFLSFLLDAVRDRADAEERGSAAWMLFRIAHPRTTRVMRELLGDRDEYIRATAARALARIGSAEAIAAVRAFVKRCRDPELVDELTTAIAKAR